VTRKDYIAIASAITRAMNFCETDNQKRGVERSALCIAEVLANDNPAFDRVRFLAACEVKS
jgi:hypothetical protein